VVAVTVDSPGRLTPVECDRFARRLVTLAAAAERNPRVTR
jgi:hypothetical protein